MLRIDKLAIQPPTVLAPMAGITDQPFRLLAKEQGCGLLVSEMVSGKGLLHNNQTTAGMLRFLEKERPFAVQLFGSQPQAMAEAARKVAAFAPDIIDINMGCPVAKVVKSGEGAALMRTPALVYEIVARMADSVAVPVTVKLRSGWDEDTINAPEVAWQAQRAGAKAVTVHARTRNQFYSGDADWQVIKAVVAAVEIPVIGNGDIKKAADAPKMLAETGCAAVMVGRAAAGNPWLFCALAAALKGEEAPAPPSLREKFALMARHLELLVEHKGELVAVKEMRQHAGHYIKGLPHAAQFRQLFNQAASRRDFGAALAAYAARLG